MPEIASIGSGRRIDKCVQCGTALPLCESLLPCDARTWLCNTCGKEYKGHLPHNFSVDELRNLRPEPVIFDRTQLPPPSKTLQEGARRLQALPDHDCRDKRQAARHPVTILVPTQQFDSVVRPIGRPAMFIARNISTSGICLLTDRAVDGVFLGLELSAPAGDLVQVLVQVLRARPRCGIYEIGGEFIARAANTTSRVLR